jgi:hypothetical protein
MKYNVEQKLFIYDTFVQCSSWRKCHRKFCRKYPDSTVPCKATIYNTVTESHSTESVLDRKKLAEEKLDNIEAGLKASQNKSSRPLAPQCRLAKK